MYRISLLFNPAINIIQTKTSILTKIMSLDEVKRINYNVLSFSTTTPEEEIDIKIRKKNLYLVKRLLKEYTEDELQYKIYKIGE